MQIEFLLYTRIGNFRISDGGGANTRCFPDHISVWTLFHLTVSQTGHLLTGLMLLLWLFLFLEFGHELPVKAQIRLAGSDAPCCGRVELVISDQWMTVCGVYWNILNAMVVCREMGCGAAVAAYGYYAYYGEGTGQVWSTAVTCSGTESSLLDCAGTPYDWDCEHSYDASVICQTEPAVRVVNSTNSCSGQVEVLKGGQWGTVCDSDWDMQDAAVVCQELNCGPAVQALNGSYFGSGTGPVLVSGAQCNGSESSLINCPSASGKSLSCGLDRQAGVICNEMKLAGGPSECEGSLLVLNQNVWGAMCSYYFGMTDALAACQHLGCGGDSVEMSTSYQDYASGITMLGLTCPGNEETLLNCSFVGWGLSGCYGNMFARFRCIKVVKQAVLRIAVTVKAGVNINDAEVKKKILDKVADKSPTVSWIEQSDGQVFHKDTDS